MINYWWQILLLCIALYFCANINYAIIISKLFSKPDIRTVGSGNPGTTNMFRIYGFKYGLTTFLLDMGKGVLSALCGLWVLSYLSSDAVIAQNTAYLCGAMAVVGHVLPLFLKFKGGKGFACSIGLYMVTNTYFTLFAIAVGLFVFLLTDRMSVFALLFVTMQFVWALVMHIDNIVILCVATLTFVIVVAAHLPNIKRLLQGTENPMGLHKTIAKWANKHKKEQ